MTDKLTYSPFLLNLPHTNTMMRKKWHAHAHIVIVAHTYKHTHSHVRLAVLAVKPFMYYSYYLAAPSQLLLQVLLGVDSQRYARKSYSNIMYAKWPTARPHHTQLNCIAFAWREYTNVGFISLFC